MENGFCQIVDAQLLPKHLLNRDQMLLWYSDLALGFASEHLAVVLCDSMMLSDNGHISWYKSDMKSNNTWYGDSDQELQFKSVRAFPASYNGVHRMSLLRSLDIASELHEDACSAFMNVMAERALLSNFEHVTHYGS